MWIEVSTYMSFHSPGKNEIEYAHEFRGDSKLKSWNPIALVGDEKNMPFGDIADFGPGIPVVSKHMLEETEDLIGSSVELLPTVCDKVERYILNVTNVVDAVDYERSDIVYFSNSTKILDFEKLDFIEEKVKGNHIFRLNEKRGWVYVSDEFKKRVEERKLTGFRFKPVWDSEAK